MNKSYQLPTSFNKNNVADELKQIAQSTTIDCANIADIDSAGIAALVYLITTKNCTINNQTPKIIALCDLYQISLNNQ